MYDMRKYKIKSKNNYQLVFSILVIFVLFFSIGYSYLATTIGLNGDVTVKGVGLMMPRYLKHGEERAFWQYSDQIEHITFND